MQFSSVLADASWWFGTGIIGFGVAYGLVLVIWAAILVSGRMDGRKSANEVNL